MISVIHKGSDPLSFAVAAEKKCVVEEDVCVMAGPGLKACGLRLLRKAGVAPQSTSISVLPANNIVIKSLNVCASLTHTKHIFR